MTTLTAYSNPNDGYLQHYGTWVQACDGTNGGGWANNDTQQISWCGMDYLRGSYPTDPNHHQMYWSFDTSSIPVSNTVTAATLTLTWGWVTACNVGDTFEVYAYDWPALSGDPWRSSSWLAAQHSSPGMVASYGEDAFYNAGAGVPVVMTPGPGAVAAVVKGGNTKLMMTVSSNRTAVQPTESQRLGFYTGDYNTNPTWRPTLTVTHSYIAPAPTISDVEPPSGAVAGGNTVTLTGTGFTGVTDIRFGSKSASFTIVSDTEITTTAPSYP